MERAKFECFKGQWANIGHILDCFEIPIETPSSRGLQKRMYSNYKKKFLFSTCEGHFYNSLILLMVLLFSVFLPSRNTIKFLIDMDPTGRVQFLSLAYNGRAGDADIVRHSKWPDFYENSPYQAIPDKGMIFR